MEKALNKTSKKKKKRSFFYLNPCTFLKVNLFVYIDSFIWLHQRRKIWERWDIWVAPGNIIQVVRKDYLEPECKAQNYMFQISLTSFYHDGGWGAFWLFLCLPTAIYTAPRWSHSPFPIGKIRFKITGQITHFHIFFFFLLCS